MVGVIRWTFGKLLFVAIFLIPWIFRGINTAIRIMAISIVSLFVGVPAASNRIANHWTSRAVDAGVPSGYELRFHGLAATFAHLLIIAGWMIVVVLAYLMLTWIL